MMGPSSSDSDEDSDENEQDEDEEGKEDEEDEEDQMGKVGKADEADNADEAGEAGEAGRGNEEDEEQVEASYRKHILMTHIQKVMLDLCAIDKAQDAKEIEPQFDNLQKPMHIVDGVLVPHLNNSFQVEWKAWGEKLVKLSRDTGCMPLNEQEILLSASVKEIREALDLERLPAERGCTIGRSERSAVSLTPVPHDYWGSAYLCAHILIQHNLRFGICWVH
ncbi:hypothetical protein RSOL_332300, partial [Rhizoctonia solani AG-3 Rhs1AP]